MRQSCFIANQSGRDILVTEWPYTDLTIMAIKEAQLCRPECIFKTISKPLGNFTENAIISNFHILISNQIQRF